LGQQFSDLVVGFDARALSFAGEHAVDVNPRHPKFIRQRAYAGEPNPVFSLVFPRQMPRRGHEPLLKAMAPPSVKKRLELMPKDTHHAIQNTGEST
jgi:hypothetical protein